jgi:acetyl-CoA acetyltransferase
VKEFEEAVRISGVGMSEVGTQLGRHPLDLAVDACLEAIEDAGLERTDIDGVSAFPGANTLAFGGPIVFDVQDALRLDLSWFRGAPTGPGALLAVTNAMAAVASGFARHVLVYRSLAMSDHGERDVVLRGNGDDPWAEPYGVTPFNANALLAMRHFDAFGTTRAQLGAIAVCGRANARRNPDATADGALSLDDYLASEPVSSPLCRHDRAPWTDGAVAFVVSTADSDTRDPVAVAAVGTALRGRVSWNQPPDLGPTAADVSAEHLWSRTELGPTDVDTAHLADDYSIQTLLWLEALGFCGKGESGAFVEGGRQIAPDGALPLNTDGGQLSFARFDGLGHLREAVLQIRGEAGLRQVTRRGGAPEVAVVGVGGGPVAGCMLVTDAE